MSDDELRDVPLKAITRESVGKAIEKAEHYRLLNEPEEAESICQDVLAIDPGNQRALRTLVLALTDQFGDNRSINEAKQHVAHLTDAYERAYYTGIIFERRAKVQIRHGTPGSGPRAYEWLRQAMTFFERAEAVRPPGNDDAILRWNTCARLIMGDPHLVPPPEERGEPLLLE